MQAIDYRQRRESWDRASAAGRVNRGTVLFVTYKRRDYVVPIGIGDSDDLDVYREGDLLVVVSTNSRLDYCGIEVFDLSDHDPSRFCKRDEPAPFGDVFAQGSEQVAELVGPSGLDLHPRTIARRLLDYVAECRC